MPSFSMNRAVTTSTVSLVEDPGTVGVQSFTVTVPTGKTVISGGYSIPWTEGVSGTPLLTGMFPNSTGTGWTFQFRSVGPAWSNIVLYVVYEDA